MKNFDVRRATPWMAMALFFAVAGCGGDSGTNGGGGNGGSGNGGGGGGTTPVMTTSVTIADFSFTPPSILVAADAMVTWTWTGGALHNVTFANATITSSGASKATGTHQATMPSAAGVYTYQCTVHPSTMQGTVTVQ